MGAGAEQVFPTFGLLDRRRLRSALHSLRQPVELAEVSCDRVVIAAPYWDAALLLRVADIIYSESGAT